jgi:hypothetical protein
MAFFSGQFRMDAVSHIITNKIAFEAFLFVYLVTALWMQHLNIYKKVFKGQVSLCVHHISLELSPN